MRQVHKHRWAGLVFIVLIAIIALSILQWGVR